MDLPDAKLPTAVQQEIRDLAARRQLVERRHGGTIGLLPGRRCVVRVVLPLAPDAAG